jgi:uncharacterized phosphatase
MRLILARHGQAVSNVDPTYVGHDAPLTEIGVRQAHLLGEWLKTHAPEIDRIVCSPLQRAHNTAKIVNEYLRLPLTVHDDLEEMREFVANSLPQREHPLQPESEFRTPDYLPYYEGYREQVARALAYLTADVHRAEPTLVVSHGGTMATLMRLIMERHDLRIHTNNTAMIDVSWSEGKWYLWGLNMIRHLPDDLIT